MNTPSAENALDNIVIYTLTVLAGFVSEHWYELAFLGFGAVHALIAFDKWKYERQERN